MDNPSASGRHTNAIPRIAVLVGLGSVLTAFLEGRLFFRNDNRQVVVVKSTEGDPLTLLDPLTMKEAGTASSDALTSIGTNNSLRPY